MVDICLMRNMLSSKEISDITWVDSQSQLADCLTKPSSRAKLLTVLSRKGTLIKYIQVLKISFVHNSCI